MWAAAYDQPYAAAFLLERGADVDAAAGPDERGGVTALHLAASAGSTAVMMVRVVMVMVMVVIIVVVVVVVVVVNISEDDDDDDR